MAGSRDGVYKGEVTKKVADYRNEMSSWLRVFMQTNPDRAQRIAALEEGENRNDLPYLILAWSVAYGITEDNSSFRDKVGKEALLQLNQMGIGALETITLLVALYALLKQNYLDFTFAFLFLMVLDQFDKGIRLSLERDDFNKNPREAAKESFNVCLQDAKKAFAGNGANPLLQESAERIRSNVSKFGKYAILTTVEGGHSAYKSVAAHDFKRDADKAREKWRDYKNQGLKKWQECRKTANHYLGFAPPPIANPAPVPAEPKLAADPKAPRKRR